MLHVLKNTSCPSCELHFTGKDGYRTFVNSRYPLLLKCGHTHCESCINASFKAQKSIKCAVCKQITNFDQGSSPILKLLPDVYVLGIVNAKQALPSLKNKLVPAVPQKSEIKNGAIVACERCKMQEASFRCKKCEENFCNICFDAYHKNSKPRRHNHTAIPIYADTYQSLVQEGCTEHDNRPIEFYCEEDNMLTCSYCVITGTHKGHNVITLKEKNQSCVKELKSAYEEALGFSKRLKLTEQKLSQAIPTEKVDCSHWVKEIRNHFHYLHSILLLRENELLQQIEDISNASINFITKLRQEVSDTTKDVEALLRDAVYAMENPTISISVPVIINKLTAVKDAPCHLLPVDDEGSDKEIELSFQGDLHENIAQHGKITADIKPKYCLRGNDDLPMDYIVEPLPQELANTADTESLASDTFSEDSLSATTLNESESLALLSKIHASPKREKPERVVVTHIVDPGCFFVRKCKDDKKLCHLTTRIVDHIRSRPQSKSETRETMEKGNIYLVRFTKDNKWYRGRFIQFFYASDIPESLAVSEPEDRADRKSLVAKNPADITLAEVYYVDFGNSEIVPLSRIRPIEREMTKYPGLAKKCSLHNIVPIKDGSWTLEAKTKFQEFVFDKEINMQIIEDINGVLHVDLCQLPSTDMVMDVPISVRDALIFLEHGTFFNEKELLKAKKIRKFRHYLPPESVNVNSRATVNIPCIESPSLFYVQQSSSSHHLSELLNEMLEAYSIDTNLLHAIYVPYIGMICAAQLPDNNWYRAEVLGLPGGAKVEVELVDFGSKQVLHHQCLRQLLDKFTKLTRQALPCTLADVSPLNDSGEWSEEAKDWLSKHTNQKRFTLLSLGYEPGSSKTRVVLYDTEGEVEICINALMVNKGMAVGTGKHSTVAYKPKKARAAPNVEDTAHNKKSDMPVVKNVVKEATNEVSGNFYEAEPEFNTMFEVKLPKPKNQLPKEHVKVVMGHSESPGLFYIRIFEYEENFKRLVADMQETYTNFESSPVNIEIRGDYAAFQESEKTWCRVIVQSVVDDKTVQARFLDYGHSVKVPVKNLRPLLPKFKNDRAYVISCYLSGITPAGDSKKWPRAAIDLFLETIAPYQVLYLVQSPDDDFDKKNPLPSDLFYEEIIRGGALEPFTVRYSSVTKVLIDAGVALPIRRKKNIDQTSPLIVSPQSSEYSNTFAEANDFDQLSPNASQQSSPEPQKVPRLPSYQWLPAKIPKEKKFKAYGTHVGHDGCIYLQVIPDRVADANFIKSTLQVKYDNSPFEPARIAPPIGEACIALFDVDKKYYRAETITDDPQRLKVQFVDYGNFEIVNLRKIQVCTITCEMPRQCIECELANIDPPFGSWPSNVLNYIHENIVETLCDIEVVEPPESGKRLQIELNFPRGNLNSLVASIFHVKKPALQNGQSSSPSCSNASMDDNCFAEARPLSLSADPFPVCVIQIVEPTVVYIQATCINPPLCEEDCEYNNKIEEFLKLLDHLAANGDHFPLVLNPIIGSPCIARYSYDGKWYRCVIIDKKGGCAIVRYVDYGNVERVHCRELRKPDFYTLNFPIQAHLVKIKDLEPTTEEWTESLGLMLKQVFDANEGQLYSRVVSKSDICEVELLVQMPDGSFKLAYEDLIHDGLLKLHES